MLRDMRPGSSAARRARTAILIAAVACGLGACTASAQAKVLALYDGSGLIAGEAPATFVMPAEYFEFTAPEVPFAFVCTSSFSLWGESLVNSSSADKFVINEVSGPLTSLESCPNLVTASGFRWGLTLTAGGKATLTGSPKVVLTVGGGCVFVSKTMKGKAKYTPQLIFSLSGTFTSKSPGCLKKAVITIGVFEGFANGPIVGRVT